MNPNKPIADFIKRHFKHFNAASLVDASEAYLKLLDDGGKMFLAMAGAMSTAELGISLSEMIRNNKMHAICCTGANLEEDIFNLVGHNKYKRVPDYRDLTAKHEHKLLQNKEYRVTDTIIPEVAMQIVEHVVLKEWEKLDKDNKKKFPHEIFYDILLSGKLKDQYKTSPDDSWLLAAAKKNLPIYVPGWEDSTLGNVYAARRLDRTIKNDIIKGGIDYMMELVKWYIGNVGKKPSIGFFQIGGGIAGDFPICAVPLIHADLRNTKIPVWAYFCQISDSTTSFGSYSGAVPNEKITWDKLEPDTPKFIIESDATIVAPLIFAYVLGMSKEIVKEEPVKKQEQRTSIPPRLPNITIGDILTT